MTECRSFDQVLQQLKQIPFPRYPSRTVHESRGSEMVGRLKDYRLHIEPNRAFKTMNQFQHQPPALGLIVLRDEEFEFATLTDKYCALERVKTKRHDQQRSQHELWTEDTEDVLRRAIASYAHYQNGNDLLGQPMDVVEDECFRRVVEVGGPGLFPAMVASGVYHHFGATKILDISAGWGDRLLAACAGGLEYTGYDPNARLEPIHAAIVRDWGDPQKQRVIVAPFETSEWPAEQLGTFDLLLSSPPFFNLEIYSSDSNQCYHRYPKLDEWLDRFLFASLRTTDRLLKAGGHAIIHMNDVVNFADPSKTVRFVQAVIRFVTTQLKWRCLGQFGYAVQKERDRPSKEQGERPHWKKKRKINKTWQDGFRTDAHGVVLAQPLFVFQKPRVPQSVCLQPSVSDTFS